MLDSWLCRNLRPLWLRWWWCRLRIRANEFHASLELDMDLALRFDDYIEELVYRRQLAHCNENLV